jgi:hypothetical protein
MSDPVRKSGIATARMCVVVSDESGGGEQHRGNEVGRGGEREDNLVLADDRAEDAAVQSSNVDGPDSAPLWHGRSATPRVSHSRGCSTDCFVVVLSSALQRNGPPKGRGWTMEVVESPTIL